ncbi:hypothetical protein [Arthrobacter sp. NicSoilB8]|uniref:hypothetical protein n=1 Tax=Arthrobacter sp. NicSoilB8 TaxID=2830998 RepID=UPI001CC6D5D5|nr:hypothetical protein [Arthrobacter sp. NicSoilB8]BCW71888.1 hypothetical protein NicSoilB8_29320 [Arthrobacter sp. NicSoilB8]
MNKAIRIIGITAVTAALGLGAGALPASAALTTSGTASGSSWNQPPFEHRHHLRDGNRHDAQHGWWDGESRWHDNADGWGWRDDHGNWRDDNDHNGWWTGRDGCRHDKDGFWDHNGHRHENVKHHHW